MQAEGLDAGGDGSEAAGGVVMGATRTTANDFHLVNATAADANNFEMALTYLQNSSLASDVIDASRGHDITFNHSDPFADEALPDGSGIVWNPDIALQLDDGNFMSAALNMLSELAHMVLPGGLGDNHTVDMQWDSPAEAIAHIFANEVAAQLGEPQRLTYSQGTPALTSSVTDYANSLNDALSTVSGPIDLGPYSGGGGGGGGVDWGGAFTSSFNTGFDMGWSGGWGGSGGGGGGGSDPFTSFSDPSYTAEYATDGGFW